MDTQETLARLRAQFGAADIPHPFNEAEMGAADAFIAATLALCEGALRRNLHRHQGFQSLVRGAVEHGGPDAPAEAIMEAFLLAVDREATNAATGFALTVVQAVTRGPTSL